MFHKTVKVLFMILDPKAHVEYMYLNIESSIDRWLIFIRLSNLAYFSQFLPPRESAKKEAQYLFASSSVDVIINMLVKIQAKRVLCVGAPRIYEAIAMSEKLEMSALMLDIDERFVSIWYFYPQHMK